MPSISLLNSRLRRRRATRLRVVKPRLEGLERRRLLAGPDEAAVNFSVSSGDLLDISPQVIDGKAAPYRPEVVRVSNANSQGSGTFITRQHILTAAHVVDSNGDFRWDPNTDSPLKVTVTQSGDTAKDGETYKVASVTIHPSYRIERKNGQFIRTYNDLAILQLETLVDDVIPVPIYRGAPRVGETVETLGFGLTGSRSTGQTQPNFNKRNVGYGVLDNVSGDLMSWANDQPGESGDAPGDSGGPSFVAANGKRWLAGVHSFGWTDAAQTGAISTDVRVDAYAGWIDSVLANDSTGPTVKVVRHDDITSPDSFLENVRIEYSDVNGIREGDLSQPHIALIGSNNYYNQYPVIGLVIRSADRTKLTVDYRFQGPGGVWTASNNGTYRVALLNRGITDGRGNPVGASMVTSFNVNLPADTTAPTAALRTSNIVSAGKPNLVTTVFYSDDFGINPSTLGDNDVVLMKSNGSYTTAGRLMVSNTIRKGTALVIPYEFAAPGGSWDSSDNGTYNVILQPNSVRDVSGNPVASRVLGSITVDLAAGSPISPWAILRAGNITTETTTHTFEIVYNDDVAVNVASILDNRSEVLVEASNRGGEFATLVGVTPSSDAKQIIATYQYKTTKWTAADNGVPIRVSILSGGIAGTVTDTSGNTVRGGPIGGFQVRLANDPPDTVAPQAALSSQSVSLESDSDHIFTVALTDDQGIEATTVTADALFVRGPDDQTYPVEIVAINYGENNPLVIATLRIEPPGGSWDPSDNGIYRVFIRAGMISDTSGNYLPGYTPENSSDGEVGQFAVAVSNVVDPPLVQATLNISGITREEDFHEFTVTYSSPAGVDVSSLGDDDIYVTDNSGFLEFAEFVRVDSNSNGWPRVVTYRISGPGGRWTKAANGTYEVHSAGGEVFNVQVVGGGIVRPGRLGSFDVMVAESSWSLDAGPDLTASESQTLFLTQAVISYTGSPPNIQVFIDWGDSNGEAAILLDGGASGLHIPNTHVYGDDGTYTVRLFVRVGGSIADEDSLQVRVSNLAPGATLVGPTSGYLDEQVTFELTHAFDPGPDDFAAGFTYAFDVGEGYGPYGANPRILFTPTSPGTVSVRAKIRDKDGAETVYPRDFSVSVLPDGNSAPTLSLPMSAQATRGRLFGMTGWFNDPDSSQWSVFVSYGDGTGYFPLSYDSGRSFLLQHAYTGAGTYTAQVDVYDADGAHASGTVLISVSAPSNIAPTVLLPTALEAVAGQPLAVTGWISDPDSSLVFGIVDYVDGKGSRPLALNADRSFRLDNVYGFPGVYTAYVTASDGEGNLGRGAIIVTVHAASSPQPSDNSPPVVVGFRTLKKSGHLSRIILGFSEAMNSAGVQLTSSYSLVSAGRDRRFGTADDRTFQISSAVYNLKERNVTIALAGRIKLNQPLKLVIRGSNVRDEALNALDGGSTGRPGSDSVYFFGTKPKGSVTTRIGRMFAAGNGDGSPAAHRRGLARLRP